MSPTQHILYPFTLKSSQGGLASAAMVTANSAVPDPFNELVFHSADSVDFRSIGRMEVNPLNAANLPLPVTPWFRHDFVYQHLQSQTDMIPEDIAKEIYRHPEIPNPGTLEYLNEFFRRNPVDFSPDEKHSALFNAMIPRINEGDVVSVQGPVWLMPFLKDNADAIKQRGAKLVYFEHQLVPEGLERTPLGRRILPCYSEADVIFFHSSVYADRLANILDRQGQRSLPAMRTVNLGIDREWIDSALAAVREPNDMEGWNHLTKEQQDQVNACLQAKAAGKHTFVCFDRADRMKGTHAVIAGIKLFLDQMSSQFGTEYVKNFHFAGVHELLNLSVKEEDNLDSMKQYIRVCRGMYQDLMRQYPGVVTVSESFTSKHNHRQILPRLIQGSHVLGLHGQDGLGLSALEAAYINRDQDTGLIIGDQSGCFLEAQRRGFDKLIYGVKAGDPFAIRDAIIKVVRSREENPGAHIIRNRKFAKDFVVPRQDTMALVP